MQSSNPDAAKSLETSTALRKPKRPIDEFADRIGAEIVDNLNRLRREKEAAAQQSKTTAIYDEARDQ